MFILLRGENDVFLYLFLALKPKHVESSEVFSWFWGINLWCTFCAQTIRLLFFIMIWFSIYMNLHYRWSTHVDKLIR